VDSTDLSGNKRIQWQPVFITNFIIVTEKASCYPPIFFLRRFSLSHYLSPVLKTGDSTVLIEVNANRRWLWGRKKALPVKS